MIRVPGLSEPGRISGAIVETVDIFPTLVDVCGIAAPAGLDGRSLRPQLSNPMSKSTKPALSFWTNGQQTIRDEHWRLIAHAAADPAMSPATELFDVLGDPDEAHNVSTGHARVVAELLARLPAPLLERAPKATDRK
jgi:iduronate 2-sulfatase